MAICDKGVEAVGRLYKARMHADYSAGMRSIPLPEAVQNASGRSTEMRFRVCSGRKKQKERRRAWQKRRTRQRPSYPTCNKQQPKPTLDWIGTAPTFEEQSQSAVTDSSTPTHAVSF